MFDSFAVNGISGAPNRLDIYIPVDSDSHIHIVVEQ